MKKRIISLALSLIVLLTLLTGCGEKPKKVADKSDMTEVVDVVEEGMTPIAGDKLLDGTYQVKVDCSSSMFKIVDCALTVSDGDMTAKLTMSSKSYLYVFPGSAEDAADAEESEYVTYEEDSEGNYTFTIPVSALDSGIQCAAYSKNKELWYDRTLLFRADSLPAEAFREGVITTAESLGLADGSYTVSVTLEGGSGKATVESPAELTVSGGEASVKLIWSSPNYDYMKLGDTRYDPVNEAGENSAFIIPVSAFDRSLSVIADTTAMSEPHEISYTLYLDSTTIEAAD